MAKTLEAAMLPAPKDSAGAKILKKMGWRLGQGIGPRLSFKQKRIQDIKASGRTPTEEDLKKIDEDEEANKHTYAPRDTPILVVDKKTNFHGLGYRPEMGLNERLGAKGGSGPAGPKLAGTRGRLS